MITGYQTLMRPILACEAVCETRIGDAVEQVGAAGFDKRRVPRPLRLRSHCRGRTNQHQMRLQKQSLGSPRGEKQERTEKR